MDRGSKVVVIGEDQEAAVVGELLSEMLDAVRHGHTPTIQDLNYALEQVRDRRGANLGRVMGEQPAVIRKDIPIKARTRGQRAYLDSIQSNGVTIAIGPAGTGKTFLAMAAAVSALLNKEVNRLILTRPAVEAGERLGFLPGDIEEKVNPYLRPLYDALYALTSPEQARRFLDQEKIEVAPLAFMRGRTLSNAFAILDEAQNTTREQMKMFLTRLGDGSRFVITGDVTQIDLPPGVKSGLIDAEEVLRGAEGIGIVHLDHRDVVRHPLVQRIVTAYEAFEGGHERPDASGGGQGDR